MTKGQQTLKQIAKSIDLTPLSDDLTGKGKMSDSGKALVELFEKDDHFKEVIALIGDGDFKIFDTIVRWIGKAHGDEMIRDRYQSFIDMIESIGKCKFIDIKKEIDDNDEESPFRFMNIFIKTFKTFKEASDNTFDGKIKEKDDLKKAEVKDIKEFVNKIMNGEDGMSFVGANNTLVMRTMFRKAASCESEEDRLFYLHTMYDVFNKLVNDENVSSSSLLPFFVAANIKNKYNTIFDEYKLLFS